VPEEIPWQDYLTLKTWLFKMIISEDRIRFLIRQRLLEFNLGTVDFKLKRTGGGISGRSNLSGVIDEDHNIEIIGQGTYVMPAPIFNDVDYSEAMTSDPQEIRTDVQSVTNSETGEESVRGNSSHTGQDFGTPKDTPIVAFLDGVVDIINTEPSANAGGKYVYIKHTGDNNIDRTGYMHLNSILVNEGDTVQAGQVIGLSGKTGNATGNHLHFSVRKVGESKDSYDKIFYDSLFANSRKAKIIIA